jgi:trehalose/maltose hydrolase-like predicted phosphorylase
VTRGRPHGLAAWASRAALENDGRHHIRRVIGPDEHHETIDDNAYTNMMAAWNIERALDTAVVRFRIDARRKVDATTLERGDALTIHVSRESLMLDGAAERECSY